MSRWEAYFRQVVVGSVARRARVVLLLGAWLWRRVLFRTTFIAVCGSLGKTTTKELLAALLSENGRTFRTWRNQNGPVLIAMSVLRVRPWHRFAVIESDAAYPGMMDWPSRIVSPDLTLMLRVGGTHTADFDGLDGQARENRKMIESTRSSGTLVINADDPAVEDIAAGFAGRVIRFGSSAPPYGPAGDCVGEVLSAGWPERLQLAIVEGNVRHDVETQLVGVHWLHGVLAAWSAAKALGVEPETARRALAAVPPFPGRMCPVQAPNGAVFLRDDYSSPLAGVDTALEVLRTARAARRWLVITDFSDAGQHRRQRLRSLARRAADCAEAVVFIGENAAYAVRRAVEAGIAEDLAHSFDTLREAARFVAENSREGDLILVKGRTTDHATRLVLAQFGEVSCWKPYCPKRMLCDECWEVSLGGSLIDTIAPLPPRPAASEAPSSPPSA